MNLASTNVVVYVSLTCIIAAGMFAGVYVHEAGHYAACLSLGYESAGITVTPYESSHTCKYGGQASGAEMLFVRAAGGGLAVVAFGVPFAVFAPALVRGATRAGNYARLFLLAGLIPQAVNLVMEAGFVAWYNDVTRAVGIAAGVVLVLWLEYNQFPRCGTGRRWRNRK